MSLVIVKLKVIFLHSASVVTSLARSHVVFKLLNYITDKIVRVALTTLVRMLTVRLWEREGEIGYVRSVCFVAHLCDGVVCVQWVIPEMIAQALATVLMLVSMHWFVFLLNLPVASWDVYRWFSPITPHTLQMYTWGMLQLTVIDVCEQIREGSHGEHGSVRSHRDSQQRPAQVPHEGSHDQTGLPPSLLLHLPVQVKNHNLLRTVCSDRKSLWSIPTLCCY